MTEGINNHKNSQDGRDNSDDFAASGNKNGHAVTQDNCCNQTGEPYCKGKRRSREKTQLISQI